MNVQKKAKVKKRETPLTDAVTICFDLKRSLPHAALERKKKSGIRLLYNDMNVQIAWKDGLCTSPAHTSISRYLKGVL